MIDMHKSNMSPAVSPVGHKFGMVFVVMTDVQQSFVAAGMMDDTSFGGSAIHAKMITDEDKDCVLRSKPGRCVIM